MDVGTFVEKARSAVSQKIDIPPGYDLSWSGQYKYMKEARERLKIVVPVTLVIVFLLLYLNFRSLPQVLIVMLTLPFSVIGGIWIMYLLNYNMSVAVTVGFIALAGVATEIGVVMIVYLDHAYRKMREEKEGRIKKMDLYQAIMAGAAERVRPIAMTATAVIAGLLPIMWSQESGARVMKRIATPMVGGMVSATILTLIIIPIVYEIWRAWQLRREARQATGEQGSQKA
jgi:Cu(I)/Ag(I) efflux system membrane protein CusA/SilA